MSRSSASPCAARADEIGRGRCDDDDACFARESDVIERVARAEDLGVNRSPGDCLERDRADELERRAGHHDIDFSACLCKQTRQPH